MEQELHIVVHALPPLISPSDPGTQTIDGPVSASTDYQAYQCPRRNPTCPILSFMALRADTVPQMSGQMHQLSKPLWTPESGVTRNLMT